jgi:hypothetical protein
MTGIAWRKRGGTWRSTEEQYLSALEENWLILHLVAAAGWRGSLGGRGAGQERKPQREKEPGQERSRVGEKQGGGAETSVVKTGWIFSSLVAVVATELGGPGRGHKRGVALATLMGWANEAQINLVWPTE